MTAYISSLDPQPVSASFLYLTKSEVHRWCSYPPRKRHPHFQHLHLPGKLSKSLNYKILCRSRWFVNEDKGRFQFSKPTKRGALGDLHVAKAKSKPLILGTPTKLVEPGKYSLDVESVVNKLSSLPPRGSIARSLDAYKDKLTLNDFSQIFREFAQRGDWQRSLRLFKYMQRQQWCKPNQHIYAIIIGILGREGLLDKCSEIFEEMPAHDVSWDVYSFTALINAYGRNGQYETSLHLLARMKREGVSPSLITYNTVINACAKGGLDWEGLLGLFAQMRHEGIQPDIITYNTLLGACSSKGLSSEAEMVFRTMNEAGIVPNTLTYTYLVETFRQVDSLDRVSELLRELELSGNLPDITAYNLLLEAYAKAGVVKKAMAVFREMQNAGCTPNASTYSILLDCYGKSGQYDDVRELFRAMKASSTEPDVITYNTLIEVFGNGGFFKEVISLFHDMVEENVEPDMESYEGLTHACAMSGLHEDAKQILLHIQNRGVVPSAKVFTSVVEAYGKAALYEDAVVAFNTMGEFGHEPNRDAYNSLINMYARGGLFIEALQRFYQMDEAGIEKDVESFNGLIEAFARAGHFDKALKVFSDMERAKCPPNKRTHETVLNVYCRANMVEEATTQFLEMKQGRSLPNIASYCLMIAINARLSRWDDVCQLLEEMQKPRMPYAHKVIGTTIMGHYDDQPNWEIVESVLDTLKLEGIGVGMMFYNALLDALWWMGQKARASKVLEEARKRGIFPEVFRQTKMVSSVDVHRMSHGAALTSLSVWIVDTQKLILDKKNIPQLASIVTVQGELEHSRDAKELDMAKVVYSFLKDMKAPFVYVAWTMGRIICHQPQLKRWLKSPMHESAALVNSSIQVPGARTGNIYVQDWEDGNDSKLGPERDTVRAELTSV